MDVARKQYNSIKVIHARLTETIIRLKSDLANNYNQDIERLKLEQKSLKSQVEAELSKLKKDKIYYKTTTEEVDANKAKKADVNKVNQNVDVEKNKEIGKTNKANKPKQTPPAVNLPIDFGRLDLRVGKIEKAAKHPYADSLYIESIEVGEIIPRNVVSGLVKFMPLEALYNRTVIILCNLKHSKIRKVLSDAMVMCASSPDKVELLEPPPGSVPGDIVTVDGYPRNPDKVLKVFDEIAPDLKVNVNSQATYKGIPWRVGNKGVVTTKSLKNVQIK